ncbi:hypothetical protein BDZ91DRAFT_720796 [Kalaharituber pfeilii]|nr:hypothetical protein BDZ91DRAFT_720796 [Kalaharituber pfeilii]
MQTKLMAPLSSSAAVNIVGKSSVCNIITLNAFRLFLSVSNPPDRTCGNLSTSIKVWDSPPR